MGTQVWTHLVDSAALAANRVDPNPPPDEEWLRIDRTNERYLAARHWAKQPWLDRLLGRPRPPFAMDPPPARPAANPDTGVPLLAWAAERIAAGEGEQVSAYLREWQPGMVETDTYDKLWGLASELAALAPYLPTHLLGRLDALGAVAANRFPPSMPPPLRVLDLPDWVFYDRAELDALLAAYDAATRDGHHDLSSWWWESLGAGAADPRCDLLALAIPWG